MTAQPGDEFGAVASSYWYAIPDDDPDGGQDGDGHRGAARGGGGARRVETPESGYSRHLHDASRPHRRRHRMVRASHRRRVPHIRPDNGERLMQTRTLGRIHLKVSEIDGIFGAFSAI